MTRIPVVKGLTLLVLSLSVAATAAETKNSVPTGTAEAKSAADAALVPLPQVPSKVSELLQDRNYRRGDQGHRRSGKGEGCAARLSGLSQRPGVALERPIRCRRRAVHRDGKTIPQERLGPASAVRQGRGAGPQGRFSLGRADLSHARSSICSRRPASRRSPICISNSPTPISSRRTRCSTSPIIRRRWTSI